jgi:hypothetical protein
MGVRTFPLLSLGVAAARLPPLASSLKAQLQELIIQHGGAPRQGRDILQPRHAHQFTSDRLFDEFARTCCAANAVPRKELFEAWATALYIDDHFPNSRRVADLACGHGLLSWALLLLGNDLERTAVCVDRRMPGSAEKVAEAVLDRWPHLHGRWDFVESKLNAIEPSSTTLLCGIHACGALSDQIISLAMQGNAPLALIPCCHSRKIMEKAERQELDSTLVLGGCDGGLAGFIDAKRIRRLQGAGFSVDQGEIPEVFTPKNRLILASPPDVPVKIILPLGPIKLPNSAWFSVPIGDTAASIATVKSISGREKAKNRKLPLPPCMCVSLFSPQEDVPTLQQLTLLTNSLFFDTSLDVKVEYTDQEVFRHVSGRLARTFRIEYNISKPSILDKEIAKRIHTELRETIPIVFPGCTVR